MGVRPHETADDESRILALVDEFLERREAGEGLSPEQFIAAHHELAHRLQPYLRGLPLIDRACDLGRTGTSPKSRPTPGNLPVIEGYELIEEIGRGGMGVVFKALQVATKRVVALKIMLAGPFASDAARRRFAREVQLAARLRHPHLVGVLESGDIEGRQYYAMEYVSGPRLDRYLQQSEPNVQTILRLFIEICEAVEYAHDQGVVHRDLKPANVLIDDEGHARILDFGLAKAMDKAGATDSESLNVSLPGQVLGTLAYLSPEQAVGAPEVIDARTDVYALGVMLYEALTSAMPYDTSGRPSEVIQRIQDATPLAPSALSDRVDAEVETILLKTLEKEKERRYASTRALAEDLNRYLEGEPILARRPSRLYILRKKFRKHRLQTILVTFMLLVGIVGISLGVHWRQKEVATARRTVVELQSDLERRRSTPDVGTAKLLYQQFPAVHETQLVWAQALWRDGEREIAIVHAETAIARKPHNWPMRLLLAEFQDALGNASVAQGLRSAAEREAGNDAEAWYVRSYATLQPMVALHSAARAARLKPDHALAWLRLTHLRRETGDLEGAQRCVDRLLELGENRASCLLLRVRLLGAQGRLREAVEVCAQIIATQPEMGHQAGAHLYRAHACRRLSEYEQALADYNWLLQVPELRTANIWHYFQRATVLWILGHTDEAVADCARFRRLRGEPSYADARRFLMLHELGRRNEAEAILHAALSETHNEWLAAIYRCLLGDTTPAQLAAAADPDQPEAVCEARYYAGEACLLRAEPDEARRWFEQCVQTQLVVDPNSAPLTPMNEYELAQWRLRTQFSDLPTSSPR